MQILLKIYKTNYKMTKHYLICKIQQNMTYYTVLCNTLYKTNSFLIAKIEVILFLIELINRKKSSYIDIFNNKNLVFNKKNLAGINNTVKMPNKSKNIKMLDVRHIIFKNKHIISS